MAYLPTTLTDGQTGELANLLAAYAALNAIVGTANSIPTMGAATDVVPTPQVIAQGALVGRPTGGVIKSLTTAEALVILSAVLSGTYVALYGIPYSVDPLLLGAGTTTIDVANKARYFRAKDGGTISKVAIQQSTSSGNISVATLSGLVGVNPPTTRTATSGAIACPAGGYAEVSLGATVDVFAPTGWFAISADNTTASWRSPGIANAGASSNFARGFGYELATSHPIPASPVLTAGLWGGAIPMVGLA